MKRLLHLTIWILILFLGGASFVLAGTKPLGVYSSIKEYNVSGATKVMFVYQNVKALPTDLYKLQLSVKEKTKYIPLDSIKHIEHAVHGSFHIVTIWYTE